MNTARALSFTWK
jgi:hypothetical protein